jgi:hypothetical protein
MSLLNLSISSSNENLELICDRIIEQIHNLLKQNKIFVGCSGIFIHNAFPLVDDVRVLYTNTVSTKNVPTFEPQKVSFIAVYDKLEMEEAYRLLTIYSRKVWNLFGFSITRGQGFGFISQIVNYTLGGYIVPSYSIYGIFLKRGIDLYEMLVKIEESQEYFYRYRTELIRKGLITEGFMFEDLSSIEKDDKDYYREISLEMRMISLKEITDELYKALEFSAPKSGIDMRQFEFLRLTKDYPPKVAFFIAERKQNQGTCNDLTVKKYISSGEFGSVSQICCQGSNDCDFSMKIISGRKNKVPNFQRIIEREVEGWKHASKLGLSSTLIEYYFLNNEYSRYCIFISELMDKTVSEILKMINDKQREDLRFRLYKLIANKIDKLHDSGYFHGDCHLKNMMLKAEDKTIYEDLDRLIKGIEDGIVQMKFIDFGMSGNIEKANNNPREMGELLPYVSRRLLKLGCLDEQFRITGHEGFGIVMMFYDFMLAGYALFSSNEFLSDRSRNLFINKQISLNSFCRPGETF